MDELNGRMMACEILVTGLIARVANNSTDPLRFLTDFILGDVYYRTTRPRQNRDRARGQLALLTSMRGTVAS